MKGIPRSGMASSNGGQVGRRSGAWRCSGRIARRTGGMVMWSSLAVVVVALVKSAVARVATADPEDYSVRAIDSCPAVGHFLQWAPQPNQLDSEGACLLCVCRDDTSALCWRRDPRRCQHLDSSYVRRLKRVRRSSLLGSLLRPTIMERNQNRKFPGKKGTCKPYQGSYSEGCPPDDWCVGCTVCDCNAEGRWDCHLLSFCGDKKPKQKKGQISAKDKIKPSYMKEFMKAAKRQTTKPKPKVVKRKAPSMTTKKRAIKPTAKPKPKPKPKLRRSIKQQPTSNVPDRSYGFNDTALAQEVVKRVMAAIQEMTHRKYGIRPEMRRWLSMTTGKPSLKFKKITKKPSPPKKPQPKLKPKPSPKPQPALRQERKSINKAPIKSTSKQTSKTIRKPLKDTLIKETTKVANKPVLKKTVEKAQPQPTTTSKRKRPHQKMLEDELKKIIAKATSKIHMQNVRSKRELAENYIARSVNENVPLSTMSTIIVTNATRLNHVSTTAMYETKDYNLPSGNGHDQYYEYSTLDDKNVNAHVVGKEDYNKYVITTGSENVTSELNTVKDTQNLAEKNSSQSENTTNANYLLSLPTIEVQMGSPVPLIPKTTEHYSLNTFSSNIKNVSAIQSSGDETLTHFPQNTTEYFSTIVKSNLKQNESVIIPKHVDSITTGLPALNNIEKSAEKKVLTLVLSPIKQEYSNNYDHDSNNTEVLFKLNDTETIDLHLLPTINQLNVLAPSVSNSTTNDSHISTRSNSANLSIMMAENVQQTTTEMKPKTIKNPYTLDTATRRPYAFNEDYDLGGFRPTNMPYMEVKAIDKRFDTNAGPNITSDDTNNMQVFKNMKTPHEIVKLLASFDTLHNESNKNESLLAKIVPVILKQNTENNTSISQFQTLLKDLGLGLTVTNKDQTKGLETKMSIQNYFRRLFRYIFSKSKKERRNMRKNLLGKQKFHKLEIINSVCHNVGPCNMTRAKKLLIKPLLKELNIETSNIFKTIKIIKGLLYLLDVPYKNDELKDNDKLKLDMTKLNLIVRGTYGNKTAGLLTETEKTQIHFIRNNTDIFMHSVGKFAETLNKLIEILTSDITTKSRRRYIRADVHSEKSKVQTVFKRIKAVLSEHDIAEETLIDALHHNLTRKDRTDILHLIYRNSDIMDNYKYRLLEILGKLKGVLGRIETIKAERRYNSMLEARKTDEEKKKAEKKKLEKAEKKKQELEKKRKELEGIGIWNMGRPNKRRKRHLEDDGVYEYLLMIMEFLLKQNAFTPTEPPVNDGIDLLLRAIQDAPDIEPKWRSQTVVYQYPKRTKGMKRIIQQKYAAVPIKRTNNELQDFNVIKPTTEKWHYIGEFHNMNNIAITRKPYKQHEQQINVAGVEDAPDDNVGEYDHRYDRQPNATKLKKANEKLVQFTAEDPNTSNLEKVMEKTVYKRVSLGDKYYHHNFDAFHNQYVGDLKVVPYKNIELESAGDVTTTKTIESPIDVTMLSPTLSETVNSGVYGTKVKSSHIIPHHGDRHKHRKPKLVWVADVPEEKDTIVERTERTTTSTISPITPTPTVRWTTEKPSTTPILIAPTRTEPRKKKTKRNPTSPDIILHQKQMDLLHSLDYIASDKDPESNQETIEQY